MLLSNQSSTTVSSETYPFILGTNQMCQRLQYLLPVYVHPRQAQKIERVERESKRIVHILYKPKNYFVREEKVWMITENMQKKNKSKQKWKSIKSGDFRMHRIVKEYRFLLHKW